MSQYHYDISGQLVVTENFWTSRWRKDTRRQLNDHGNQMYNHDKQMWDHLQTIHTSLDEIITSNSRIENALEPRMQNLIQTIHTSLDEKYQILLEEVQRNSNIIRGIVDNNMGNIMNDITTLSEEVEEIKKS